MAQEPPSTNIKHIHFDWQEWLPYVEGSDLTDDQKKAMIEALWSIVLTFVDLGWEVGPAPTESCGQVPDLAAALRRAVVNSEVTEQEET